MNKTFRIIFAILTLVFVIITLQAQQPKRQGIPRLGNYPELYSPLSPYSYVTDSNTVRIITPVKIHNQTDTPLLISFVNLYSNKKFHQWFFEDNVMIVDNGDGVHNLSESCIVMEPNDSRILVFDACENLSVDSILSKVFIHFGVNDFDLFPVINYCKINSEVIYLPL